MFTSKHVLRFRAWEFMKVHSSVSVNACLCSGTVKSKQLVMITD